MPDPISSWGDAEKEKWKAIQKTIPLANRIGKFIGTIIGPAAVGLGGLLSDEMKAWRAANLERIAYKWSRKRKRRRIYPEIIKQLPFREAVAVIDAASKEDDDDVQELWARLITNATDIEAQVEIKKMHIDLIKSLNGLEACVLRAIFAWHDSGDFSDKGVVNKWKTAMKRWPKLSSDQLRVCMQNLPPWPDPDCAQGPEPGQRRHGPHRARLPAAAAYGLLGLFLGSLFRRNRSWLRSCFGRPMGPGLPAGHRRPTKPI